MVRRFSDVRIYDTEVAPTLEQGNGSGGNNLPMIMTSNTVKNTDMDVKIPCENRGNYKGACKKERRDEMLHIKFEYRDAYTNGKWNKQECVMSSVEQCKKVYGLGVDCEYRIIEVKDDEKNDEP